MTDWRLGGDTVWHAGAVNAGYFVTLCPGRWLVSDELVGKVVHSENPPDDKRCEVCERKRIDIEWINCGLGELVAAYDVLGGEC